MDSRVTLSESFYESSEGSVDADQDGEAYGDHQGPERNRKGDDRNAGEDKDDGEYMVEDVRQFRGDWLRLRT